MTFSISELETPIAVLVNDHRYNVRFDTPVKELLPYLDRQLFLRHALRELTVADLLDHQSEFLRTTNLWESPVGEIPWQSIEPIVSLLRHLPLSDKYVDSADFRHGRNYSNECFALAAAIIEKKTGLCWGRFVTERVLKPLGMQRTYVGVAAEQPKTNYAGSYSVRVGGLLEGLRCGNGQYPGLSYQAIHKYFSGEPPVPELVEVAPSQVSAAAVTYEQTPIGAAAGMMSTASDLLKFYETFLEMYNVHHQGGRTSQELSEIELAMLTLQDYISNKAADPAWAYAGGWQVNSNSFIRATHPLRNITHLPWDPMSTSPKVRWPGADGDNARRLERAMTEGLGLDPVSAGQAWAFFQQDHSLPRSGPYLSPPAQTLALYHGGNMTGATSFCLLHPATQTAVVVLCNTRGFLLDAANLVGMLLADCLISSSVLKTQAQDCSPESASAERSQPAQDDEHIRRKCDAARQIGQHIRAGYLYDVLRYEMALQEGYHPPEWTDADRYGGCVGRYRLCEGVWAVVGVFAEGNGGGDVEGKALRFWMYERGFKYPLRVKKGSPEGNDGDRITMTFAMPMDELIPLGVGGNNRLAVEDFVLVFRNRDGKGRFGEFAWNFDREGVQEGSDLNKLAWKRFE
ncbi:Beta-lactamase [Madurella mycetomatis]|uniref:Beta-lactamase n=1 Tax=Madurella mycetomatis TaxID=100816 RepID=A0A175WHL2_9PEZI|nr:Beta-lactamase [Madurella mycetomatis]